MAHYKAYDSFKTKKSMDKKQRAKEKAFGKKVVYDKNFIVENSDECDVVIEVRYNDAFILRDGKIIIAHLRKDINEACNKVLSLRF